MAQLPGCWIIWVSSDSKYVKIISPVCDHLLEIQLSSKQ